MAWFAVVFGINSTANHAITYTNNELLVCIFYSYA